MCRGSCSLAERSLPQSSQREGTRSPCTFFGASSWKLCLVSKCRTRFNFSENCLPESARTDFEWICGQSSQRTGGLFAAIFLGEKITPRKVISIILGIIGVVFQYTRTKEDTWIVPNYVPIPLDRLQISYVRSSGSGGQNVNKVNTQVQLRFHVLSASWLPYEVRERLQQHNRINKAGELLVACQEHRTQTQNQQQALKKLQVLHSQRS